MNIYPYVYHLSHKVTGQFYFGVRWANKIPAEDDLGKAYFTSSKTINDIGFDNFTHTILAEFFDSAAARDFESHLIDVNWGNPDMLNQHNRGSKFHKSGPMSETQKASISASKKGKPCLDSHRAQISATMKGRPNSYEHNKNISDGLRGILKSDDHKAKLAAANFGKTHSEETKAKIGNTMRARRHQPAILLLSAQTS